MKATVKVGGDGSGGGGSDDDGDGEDEDEEGGGGGGMQGMTKEPKARRLGRGGATV